MASDMDITDDSSSSDYDSATSGSIDCLENNSSLPSISVQDSTEVAKDTDDNSSSDKTRTAGEPSKEQDSTKEALDTSNKSKSDLRKAHAKCLDVRSRLSALTNLYKPTLWSSETCHQAGRAMRRDQLARRCVLRSQMLRGRGDPSIYRCFGRPCSIEGSMFQTPCVYMEDEEYSNLDIPVKDYYAAFAQAMADNIFPGTTAATDKAERVHSLLSFVESPPVKLAYARFTGCCDLLGLEFSETMLLQELATARCKFQSLMFGVKTQQQTKEVHRYLEVDVELMLERWTLMDLIMRFLICAELWRQQKTPRTASWRMGSRERVAEFLTAILYNYHLMTEDGCLGTTVVFGSRHWDGVWEEWLTKYPLIRSDDGFVLREMLDETEDAVLNEVGYLGGVGRSERYSLARRSADTKKIG